MRSYDSIHTIRYMGNKAKLLSFVVPEIEALADPGEVVCDLCAGTNSVGYALKRRNRVISNDIQFYSTVIARALLVNQSDSISPESCQSDLERLYLQNMENPTYSLMADLYSDKYFSPAQCRQVDSIRFALEHVEPEGLRCLYLTNLMGAMCVAQSSPGHFAQFLRKDHPRVQSLRSIDIWQTFLKLSLNYSDMARSSYKNEAFNMDCNSLLEQPVMKEVSCFYLDSPYTQEQYSRFYHVLETVCKYDYPEVTCKAGYRGDRYKSDFCYKAKVESAFSSIFERASDLGKPIVVSYSKSGVLSCDRLEVISREYYKEVRFLALPYSHSTQGKGKVEASEVLLVLSDPV